jgi:hypothetical protein
LNSLNIFYLNGPCMFLCWHNFLLLYFKVLKHILMMSSHLCLQIDRPKKLLILNATVCCVISHILLFDMGMHECLEKILTWTKWKWKHECNISFFKRSNTFTLQFGLYEFGGCAGSSSHAHAYNFLGVVCFHLGTWIMFQNL